jgi:type VI secretion system protein ImpC
MQHRAGLKDIFDPATDPSYAPWKSFRQSDDSRYVGLCLPHILLREPYKADPKREGLFVFREEVEGNDHSKFLWGNAAYALATRMTEAFFNHRWCVSIRGPRGGGLVEGLPTHTFTTDRGGIAQMCPTEIAITERTDRELSELGFIPLVHCQHTDKAAFFATPTCQEPKLWNTDEANANAALSARLQYIMATSRFAHYLKVMMRDYIGDYMTRDECQAFLSRWIADYVTKDPDADQRLKAERPLSDARIEVEDDPARPGSYRAIAFLRPHFQLESLQVDLRLVAELPAPAR